MLGIQLEEVVAADPKEAAQKCQVANYLSFMRDITAGFLSDGGLCEPRACLLHPQQACKIKEKIDLSVIGFPCSPYSFQRNGRLLGSQRPS